jgi:hypothetical protein
LRSWVFKVHWLWILPRDELMVSRRQASAFALALGPWDVKVHGDVVVDSWWPNARTGEVRKEADL